jgi:hypothetical protein
MTTTETKWAERIQEWQASGKRAEEFVTDQPYKASTLKWWATELRRRSGEGVRPRKRRETSEIRMARVVRRGRPASQASGVVVEVSGARIAIERGFDAELLSEVVRVLGGAR